MTTDIRPEFEVHVLNHEGLEKARKIARVLTTALNELEEICEKDGREMSIVRTDLQNACFFAKRAMALRPKNQLMPKNDE